MGAIYFWVSAGVFERPSCANQNGRHGRTIRLPQTFVQSLRSKPFVQSLDDVRSTFRLKHHVDMRVERRASYHAIPSAVGSGRKLIV